MSFGDLPRKTASARRCGPSAVCLAEHEMCSGSCFQDEQCEMFPMRICGAVGEIWVWRLFINRNWKIWVNHQWIISDIQWWLERGVWNHGSKWKTWARDWNVDIFRTTIELIWGTQFWPIPIFFIWKWGILLAMVSSRKNDEKQWGGVLYFQTDPYLGKPSWPILEETGAGVWSRILKWLLLGGAAPVQVYSSSSKCVYVYYIIM